MLAQVYIFIDQLPNISRLLGSGCYSYEQRNQIPAVSAPNWATVLTGMPPSDTGIHDNDWSRASMTPADITTEGLPPLSGTSIPTFLDAAKAGNKSFGAAYSWAWIEKLIPKDGTDKIVSCEYIDDDCVTRAVLKWIDTDSFPDVSFVYFGAIDEMGHRDGWGSDTYYEFARKTDGLLGRILEALEKKGLLESLLIAVTADHGGYLRDHGAFNQVNMETPAIYSYLGKQIRNFRKGSVLKPHSNMRFLPTCLNAIGIKIPDYMSAPLDLFSARPNHSVVIQRILSVHTQ